MPAYNYNPYNPYQPYVPYQPYQTGPQVQPQYTPPVQQQPQQTTQQPTQAPIQNGGLVEVRSYDEVERWPVAPGNVVTFIKYDRTEMYTKTASYNQFEAPVIATFLITRKDGGEAPQNAEAAIPYAMKDDVSALAGVVRNIDGSISALKEDIDGIKKDMYGIAGKSQKKAPAKKQEVEDDA